MSQTNVVENMCKVPKKYLCKSFHVLENDCLDLLSQQDGPSKEKQMHPRSWAGGARKGGSASTMRASSLMRVTESGQ